MAHNLRVLGELAGGRPLWPVIKSNAYGHGAVGVARSLVALGYRTLCVARVPEALELVEAGIEARCVLLSPACPEYVETIARRGFEPAVCRPEALDALAQAGEAMGRVVSVHVKIDTGMGRTGIQPDEVPSFLERCRARPGLRIRGLMSHFPRADEGDPSFSLAQLERFRGVCKECEGVGIETVHMANSAALFDVPGCVFEAARPGISIYGLRPSPRIANPRVAELRPVLEWKARIAFLKEVRSGVGISYGHTFRTTRPSLIATLPLGYGDGLPRLLSNRMEVLLGGVRCPQVGNITMDQFMVDVTALRGRVRVGDEAC
jgi:alanine racemase